MSSTNSDEPAFLCKAVIFDMDGTLIDSTKADFLAWQELFSFYGKSLTYEEYIPLLGIKSAQVVKEFLPVTNDEEIQIALTKKLVFFHEYIAENGIYPVPYAKDFLKQIKELSIPVALATSSRKAKMEMVMTKVELVTLFDAIVTGGDVKKGKPAPDIFIKAAEKLGVRPQDCIVFEDASNGVKAAKNAFMKCVALSSTQPPEALKEADIIVESFRDLSFRELCLRLKKSSQ